MLYFATLCAMGVTGPVPGDTLLGYVLEENVKRKKLSARFDIAYPLTFCVCNGYCRVNI